MKDEGETLSPEAIGAQLDANGWADLGRLISDEEAGALKALYPQSEPFRSHIHMRRHGYGEGEYKYFAYPLPPLIARLRTALYPTLATIANEWQQRIGSEHCYPASHDGFLAKCHAAGQTRPTPLILKYGEGDYNCLHQDLYGETVFPFANRDPVKRRKRLFRRRIRAHRAAPAYAVPRRGRAFTDWPRRRFSGQ